jgi:hypothetical protein
MSINIYQEFANLLEVLCSDLNNIDASVLRQRTNELKQYFLNHIVILTDLTSQQQSYHTEMSKQLGLLEIDVMFLQGAKQSATAQTRLKAITERLNTLIRYCESIINPE